MKKWFFYCLFVLLISSLATVHPMEKQEQTPKLIYETVLKKYSDSIYSLQCLIMNDEERSKEGKTVIIDLDSSSKKRCLQIIDHLLPSYKKQFGYALLLVGLGIAGHLFTLENYSLTNNFILDGLSVCSTIAGVKQLINASEISQDKKGYKYRNLLAQPFVLKPKEKKLIEIFFDPNDECSSTIKLLINNKTIELGIPYPAYDHQKK